MSAPETPAGGLTAAIDALRLAVDEECPHDTEGNGAHAEGTCEVCDYAFTVDALIEEATPALAAAVVQARAEDRARIEAALALANEWETAHGDPPVDPSHISVRHANALRAALTATEDGDRP